MKNDKNKIKLIENYVEQHYGNTADDGMKAKLRNAASVGWELCSSENKPYITHKLVYIVMAVMFVIGLVCAYFNLP